MEPEKPRRPKKTEILEVRIDVERKRALMDKCGRSGRSASEVVRTFIDEFLAEADPPSAKAHPLMILFSRPAAAAALGAVLLASSVVLPSSVTAALDLRAAYDRLDRDSDGNVTRAEFLSETGGDMLFVARDGEAPPSGAAPFTLPLRRDLPAPTGFAAPPASLLESEFARQDGDRSGELSFAEFARYHEALIRQGFDRVDVDRSGAIEAPELARVFEALPPGLAMPRPRFEELDRNRDGRIDWDEFTS